jgi:hypothetical protein
MLSGYVVLSGIAKFHVGLILFHDSSCRINLFFSSFRFLMELCVCYRVRRVLPTPKYSYQTYAEDDDEDNNEGATETIKQQSSSSSQPAPP